MVTMNNNAEENESTEEKKKANQQPIKAALKKQCGVVFPSQKVDCNSINFIDYKSIHAQC